MCTFSLHTRTRTDYRTRPCVSSVPQSALDSCTPREAEEEAASVRAEAAAAQSQLRKATAYATSLAAAGAVADEKARKLREAADRLAPPKSD